MGKISPVLKLSNTIQLLAAAQAGGPAANAPAVPAAK